MTQYIAERTLILEVIKTGERRNLTIRIGIPYWDEAKKTAFCAVEYDGLFDTVADVGALDTLLALELACNIDLMLVRYTKKYRFYWSDGELYDVSDHLKDQIQIIQELVSR